MPPVRVTVGQAIWIVLIAVTAFLSVRIQPAAAQVALWLMLALMVLGASTRSSGVAELPSETESEKKPPTYRFPHAGTLGVSVWLLMLAAGVGFALVSLMIPGAESTFLGCEVGSGQASAGCAEAVRLGIALCGGLVGSTIYSIERFIEFSIKSQGFERQYVAWYVARPAQAALLALTFYLLIRGGILAIQTQSPESNVGTWGLGSVSVLVGLFANDAMQRLRDTFKTLFGNEPAKPNPPG